MVNVVREKVIVTRTVIVYRDSFVKVAAILDLEPIFVQKVIGIGAHYLETPKMKYRYDVLKYTNIKLIFFLKFGGRCSYMGMR